MLDIHTDFVESPELVRDRILYAVDVFGDPERIDVCPDCGLRTRSWDVAYDKLRSDGRRNPRLAEAERWARSSTQEPADRRSGVASSAILRRSERLVEAFSLFLR